MTENAVAILGGRGMLGSDLSRVLQEQGFSAAVYDLPEFDLTNEEQLSQIVSEGGIIVNCAAYTNVDKAESEPETADRVNGYAVGCLGQLAKDAGVAVLHISTDFVFNGAGDKPYTETSRTDPIGAYGSSKLLGERLLAESGCQHCIVRVQWTYGAGGVNFVTKITGAAKTRDELNVVNDQIGSPTSTVEAARAICQMLQMDSFPTGLYHLAAEGYVSRYEMTQYLFDRLGITTTVNPCKSADYKAPAARPLNSRFDCTKLESLLGRSMPTWQAMLNTYLETL